jgi:superfamily II DNA or RNA helicase
MSEITLFPDQHELMSDVRKEWGRHLQILIYASTGFGKTRIAAYMINGMIKKGLKVCFVVPRVSLIKQTIKSFNALGMDNIGVIWADHEEDARALITVASAQTVIRREQREFDVIFNDECDIRFIELLRRMAADKQQRYVGLTATPYAHWLGNYYSKMVKAKSMKWLIENGRLSPYDVFVPTQPDLSKVPLVYDLSGEKDYNQELVAQVMNGAQVVGDIVQNWLQNGENRMTMVLCVNVLHGGHVTNAFNNAGIVAELITGSTP